MHEHGFAVVLQPTKKPCQHLCNWFASCIVAAIVTQCVSLLLLQVGQLHGDMTPLERAAVLEAARKGAFQLLLASDVAARGLDMPQVGGKC
jgi:superfamily II DNA/RNA helicase